MLFSMVKCYLEYTFSVILCHLYGSVYIYYSVYIYIKWCNIYIYITYICGDEKSFRVSLNEDGAFSMSFVYALEAPNVCSSDVLPMFYRDVEAVEARTLFPPCLLKSSIWAKFLRLAISLSDSVDQKMCRAWHDWNLAGHRWHRHSKRQLKPVSTPGESQNHRNSGDG